MTGFPGPSPMHGDTVEFMADTFVATITGCLWQVNLAPLRHGSWPHQTFE